MRKSGSFVDLLIGCIKISVTDIVADGSGKQMGILQDNTEGAAQIIFFDLGDIDAVIADFSLLNIVETVDQVGNCCLPAPVEPTNASFCPGLANRLISFKMTLFGL